MTSMGEAKPGPPRPCRGLHVHRARHPGSAHAGHNRLLSGAWAPLGHAPSPGRLLSAVSSAQPPRGPALFPGSVTRPPSLTVPTMVWVMLSCSPL